MSQKIHLGFEVGSGQPVAIPVRHMAVTGQTQESGKTTTLEALITRSGLPAIAFITKRGESGFRNSRRIKPYFRERADWQFVESIIESTMKEKKKFERAWIIRACEGAHTLADVQRRLPQLEATAKRAMDRDMYMLLSEYLKKVVPQIQRLPKSSTVDLSPGLVTVMDLLEYSRELQALVIASTLQWIHEKERGVITIIPEAWKFIPQGIKTPVRVAAEDLVREGAGIKNYVWVDSQDMVGVDKTILRACAVWLVGVQREWNEVRRALKNMSAGLKKLKGEDVATLQLGQFFMCYGREIRKTYVQPEWMGHEIARDIAISELPPPPQPEQHWSVLIGFSQNTPDERRPPEAPETEQGRRISQEQEDEVAILEDVESLLVAGKINDALETIRNARGQNGLARTAAAEVAAPPRGTAAASNDAMQAPARNALEVLSEMEERSYSYVRESPAQGTAFPPSIHRAAENPSRDRSQREARKIQMDTTTLDGRIALLIADGFFNERKGNKDTLQELALRGWPDAAPNVSKAFSRLVRLGFLRNDGEGRYKAVEGMKVNILEAAA